MIKKSILTAVALLALYHLLLPHLSRRFYQINGQQRSNYLRAQSYIYDVAWQTNVILGSSMALTLNDEKLGPDYYKLTLPGGNVLTGLDLISKAGKRPRLVLIETNNFGANADEEFLHDLFTPWLFRLRGYSPIFKEEGRPSNFVVGIMEACVRRSNQLISSIQSGGYPKVSAPDSGVDPILFAHLLRINHETLDHPVSPAFLSNGIRKLGAYVDSLSRNGSTCVFFEMPMDSSLAKLAQPAAVRRAVAMRFPKTRYHWLEFARDQNYETVDGIHLTRPEADYITDLFVEQVAQITHKSIEADPTFANGKRNMKTPFKPQ